MGSKGRGKGEPWVRPEVLLGGHPLYAREGQRWRCRVCRHSISLARQRGHYDKELRLHGTGALLRILETDPSTGTLPPASRRP